MSVPSDLQYSADREWVALEDDIATVGITEYAAEALGDVVYVELPEVGSAVAAGTTCGEVESTKSFSDLFAPVDGEVVEINQDVVADPSAVNLAPYDAGWLFRVRVSGPAALMSAEAYTNLIAND